MLRMSLIGMAEQRQEPLIIVSILDRHRFTVTGSKHFLHMAFMIFAKHHRNAMFSLFHASFFLSSGCVAREDYYLHPF